MPTDHSSGTPPASLGLTSIVLGGIALGLFILPILAMPISVGGIIVAIFAIIRSRFAKGLRCRAALAGLCVCCLAFAVGFAIDSAPIESALGPRAPRMWQEPESSRNVPTPLRPFHPASKTQSRAR